MALFTIENTRIAGVSACVPEKVISNHDYTWISEKDRNLLIKTTGVENKRVVGANTTASDLCYVAAERLIEQLSWKKDEIEILIFVSQSRDYILPHTSAILQDRLGLSKKCLAFDVGLGCTAFVYGLSIINSLISSGKIKKGLLLMGDISSNGSYRDKSSYPLFGDAGTATACIFDETAPDSYYNLQTDGAGYDAIIAPTGGNRNKFFKKALVYKKIEDGIYRNAANVVLNGIEVFNFALREVAPNVISLLEYANAGIETIDHFVLHQANKLMNNTIRMKLKAPKDKFPLSLDKYGNTSSATIPVTIVSELREKVSNGNLNMLFSGFGVGLSWGSVLTQTKDMVCPEMLIYEEHIKHLNQNKYHYKVK